MGINSKNNNIFTSLDGITNLSLTELKAKAKQSKMQQYRECVKDKIARGRVDYMNTEVDISKRDMYSILTELGVEITTKDTNYSANFIDWYGTDDLFLMLKSNVITVGKFVRLVRSKVKRNIGVTTLQYKLREKGIVKTELGYNEYELYKELKEESSQLIELSEQTKDYIIREYTRGQGLELLVTEYSIGELASVLPVSLNDLCITIKLICEENKKVKKWVEFINVWNPNALEYRVDNVELFDKLLEVCSVKDVAQKYKLPLSTVKDYKRRIKG